MQDFMPFIISMAGGGMKGVLVRLAKGWSNLKSEALHRFK